MTKRGYALALLAVLVSSGAYAEDQRGECAGGMGIMVKGECKPKTAFAPRPPSYKCEEGWVLVTIDKVAVPLCARDLRPAQVVSPDSR